MRKQEIRIGMTLMVLIVGVVTVMTRSVVESTQTPTADELAEMTAIRSKPRRRAIVIARSINARPSPAC